MSSTVTSYIRTAGTVDSRAADNLSITVPGRPQATTFYTRMIERGTVLIASARVWQWGNTSPYLICYAPSGVYMFLYNNGLSAAVSSQAASAPDIGDVVELVCQLSASGTATIIQSINAATPVSGTASAARVLPSAWASNTFYIGQAGSASAVGVNPILDIVIQRGVQTMATMRRLAGVT